MNTEASDNALESNERLRFTGEVSLALAYRFAPPDDPIGPNHRLLLDEPQLERLKAALTTARFQRKPDGSNSGKSVAWKPKRIVNTEMLLPHLSELFGSFDENESGKQAPDGEPIGPSAISTFELGGSNLPAWDKGGRRIEFGGMHFTIRRAPALYVFGTGIGYVLLSLTPVPTTSEQDHASSQDGVWADELQTALRSVVRQYGDNEVRLLDADSATKTRNRGWFDILASVDELAIPEPTLHGGVPDHDAAASDMEALWSRAVGAPDAAWNLVNQRFVQPFLPRGWTARVPWSVRATRGEDRRRTAPVVIGNFRSNRPLSLKEREGWRELLKTDHDIDPNEETPDALYRPSQSEICLFGQSIALWVGTRGARDANSFLRGQAFLYLLADHQRLFLISLTTWAAKLPLEDGSATPLGSASKHGHALYLRQSLVQYNARYHFVTVSVEGRHERFYRQLASVFRIDNLLDEAEREVHGVHELAELKAARTREGADTRRNAVLTLLTFVSLLDIWLGLWQVGETPPFPASGAFWLVSILAVCALILVLKLALPEDWAHLTRVLRRRSRADTRSLNEH
jgi:hypothetical protein